MVMMTILQTFNFFNILRAPLRKIYWTSSMQLKWSSPNLRGILKIEGGATMLVPNNNLYLYFSFAMIVIFNSTDRHRTYISFFIYKDLNFCFTLWTPTIRSTKMHGVKTPSTHQNPKRIRGRINIARLWKSWKGLSDPATLVLRMKNSYDYKNS